MRIFLNEKARDKEYRGPLQISADKCGDDRHRKIRVPMATYIVHPHTFQVKQESNADAIRHRGVHVSISDTGGSAESEREG